MWSCIMSWMSERESCFSVCLWVRLSLSPRNRQIAILNALPLTWPKCPSTTCFQPTKHMLQACQYTILHLADTIPNPIPSPTALKWKFVTEKIWKLGSSVMSLHTPHPLVGQVARRLPRERKIPGSNPACAWIFLWSSHTSDLKIGTPVAILPGAWRYRVSTGTGRPGVSILWLGEVERLICNFYLSVAARTVVWADPSLRYTSLLLGR